MASGIARILIPVSLHAIFNSVLSQLVCSHSLKSRLHVCPRTPTWPQSWLCIRRELTCSSSQTHIIYGSWLQVLSELVQQRCRWRLSSWRHGDPKESSVLRFTATKTVHPDPADDKHKPGLIFWASVSCRANRTPDMGAVLRKEWLHGRRWWSDTFKKKNYLSYIRKNQYFLLFYCKLHIHYTKTSVLEELESIFPTVCTSNWLSCDGKM